MSSVLEMLTVAALYDLSHIKAAPLLSKVTYPWEVLDGLGAFIRELGAGLPQEEYTSPAPGVWVHNTARTRRPCSSKSA